MIKIVHSSGSNSSNPHLCCFCAQVWAMSSFEEAHLGPHVVQAVQDKEEMKRLDGWATTLHFWQFGFSVNDVLIPSDDGAHSCTLETISRWKVSTMSVHDRDSQDTPKIDAHQTTTSRIATILVAGMNINRCLGVALHIHSLRSFSPGKTIYRPSTKKSPPRFVTHERLAALSRILRPRWVGGRSKRKAILFMFLNLGP